MNVETYITDAGYTISFMVKKFKFVHFILRKINNESRNITDIHFDYHQYFIKHLPTI